MSSDTKSLSKRTLGTTFIVAISILGVVIFIEAIAISVALIRKAPLPSPTPEHLTMESPTPLIDSFIPQSLPPTSTQAQEESLDHARANAERLFKEAQSLANKGDFEKSLDIFAQADILLPNTPEILARMAQVSEQAGHLDDAIVYWQRVLELGPTSVNLQKMAELRLNILSSNTPPTSNVIPPATNSAVSDLRDNVGLQPGATLGIIDCRISDPAKDTRIFRISVKSRPGTEVDAGDVRILMTIYEKEGEAITETEVNPGKSWLSEPVDWKEDNIEILQVTYPMPSHKEGDPPRNYYGYKIEVYYKNQLQDFRTEPGALREQFPPRITLDPRIE